MSVRSIWSIMFFKFTVSLLILYLDNPSIVESVALKSQTIIILLFISPSSSSDLANYYKRFISVVGLVVDEQAREVFGWGACISQT